jgi:hypothetical protein
MNKADKDALIKWANTLTNEELEGVYYDSVFDSLGSQCEDMYELGYDMRDIEERRKHEKYLAEKSSLLESLCRERGINLWDSVEDLEDPEE